MSDYKASEIRATKKDWEKMRESNHKLLIEVDDNKYEFSQNDETGLNYRCGNVTLCGGVCDGDFGMSWICVSGDIATQKHTHRSPGDALGALIRSARNVNMNRETR